MQHGLFMTGIRLVAATLGLFAASPSSAAPEEKPPLPDLEAMTGQQVLDLWRETGDRWLTEPCGFGVPVTTALAAKTPGSVRAQRASLYAQAICADKEKRYADGAALAARIRKLTPDSPATGLALYFARRLEDSAGALGILRELQRPELAALDQDSLWWAVRMIRDKGRGNEFEALALGWIERGDLVFFKGDMHEGIAMNALREAARTGRDDLADTILRSITSPASYIDLLVERKYERFWPLIERRAGANLSLVGAEHVQATKDRLINAPDNRDLFSDAAHALHYNGQFEDAIKLAQRWRDRSDRGYEIEEGDGWAMNIQAYAYDSLGERAKADAVFDELAQLDPEKHPWVVNFVINRSSRLVGQGRWEEGLAALPLARTVAATWGSDYARMIVASNYTCALPKAGRTGEAGTELEFLRANWKEGIPLAVQGLLCHELKDEAADLLLQGLRDELLRQRAIAALTSGELDLFYTASILPDADQLVDSYPELAEELSRHVRPIPPEFVPQAALKRAAHAIDDGTY